jgi:hypothetical protein
MDLDVVQIGTLGIKALFAKQRTELGVVQGARRHTPAILRSGAITRRNGQHDQCMTLALRGASRKSFVVKLRQSEDSTNFALGAEVGPTIPTARLRWQCL